MTSRPGRHGRYVAHIEQLLRDAGRPFVAVDDAKAAVFSDAKIDSLDFLVYMPQGDHWLAIVLPPSRPCPSRRQRAALGDWQRVFGSGFVGVFIHAAALPDEPTVRLPNGGRGDVQPLRAALGLPPERSDRDAVAHDHSTNCAAPAATARGGD